MILKHHKLNDGLSPLENKFYSAFVGLTASMNHPKEKTIEILKIAKNNVADMINLRQQIEQKISTLQTRTTKSKTLHLN